MPKANVFYRYTGKLYIPGRIVEATGMARSNPRTGWYKVQVRYPADGEFKLLWCSLDELIACNPPETWLTDHPITPNKMSEPQKEKKVMPFETHAIVELMGHQKIAGKVSEQVVASNTFLRIDVPKTSDHEPYTKLYGANAVYCITPTDEATAQLAAESFDVPPISPYILRMPESPALAEKVIVDDEDYGFDEDGNRRTGWDDDDEILPDDDVIDVGEDRF